jgi:cytochrome c biogenesis protein CcmG/thiol:disulfide interchange protein DsbE
MLMLALGSCRNSQPAQIGTTAPDFTIQDGARTVTLSQYRGKVVLLNFWATWCQPCVEEVPSLVALQQRMGDRLTILAVSMDVDQGAYDEFVAKHMQGVLTVRDPQHKSSEEYGTYAYPETYVIGRDGKIDRKFIGPVEWTSPEMLDYFNRL